MTTEPFDPIRLEVWWSRLVAIADEAATALLRTAFSTIIRESNDYIVVLMDAQGRTIAECRAGIPAFAALMNVLAGHVLTEFPADTWRAGDVVVTNHPWLATGHLPDIAMMSPIFHRGVLVGFAATAAHVPDIGGTPGMGVTDLMSEGLLLPPLRLYRAGVRNDEVAALLSSNVRLSEQVWGDLEAQLAAHDVCRRRAIEFLDDTGHSDFSELSAAVREVAEHAMRRAIGAVPDGVYRSVTDADGVPGQSTHIECAVTVRGEDIIVDYTGSSPQVEYAVNCTLNYTTAYTIYPLKLLLDPFTRANHGSYRAITVTAPAGSILNPTFPAPVLARHLTGHLLACALYRALADVLPDRVIADSGGSPALRVQFSGHTSHGDPFALILFASAGMGAGRDHDGLSTTAFPTNSGGGSIEALESAVPLLFGRKEFRVDSGGAGAHRGGLGQDIEVRNITGETLRVALLGERSRHPALGIAGGMAGAVATAVDHTGRELALKSVTTVPAGGGVTVSFAGGGGYGSPAGRDRAALAADLRDGLVTIHAAIRDYGADAVAAAREAKTR